MIVVEELVLPDLTREELASLFDVLTRSRNDAERALCERVSAAIAEQVCLDVREVPLA